MRLAAASLFGLVLAGAAAGADDGHRPATHGESCLSSGDAQEVVGARQVVTPARAIVQARQAVPNADVLRASLCRETDALVYRITVLRRGDGRVMRVTVDAPSGKVMTIH